MNALRHGENLFHQLGLGSEVDFNIALTDLGETHRLGSEGMLPVGFSHLRVLELHVTIHSLAGRSLHDDMCRISSHVCIDQMVCRQVLADELMHLRDGDGVGDLQRSIIVSQIFQ